MKKKILLTAAFTMLAAVGFAQTESRTVRKEAILTPMKEVAKVEATPTSRPRHSLADGTWYSRPVGMMFLNVDKEFRSYTGSLLNVPPFYQTIFTNECTTNNVTWTINDNDYTDSMDPETGDYYYWTLPRTSMSEDGFSRFYIPTIHNGKSSYFLLDTNESDGKPNEDGTYAVVSDETVDMLLGYNDMSTNSWYGQGGITPDSHQSESDLTYIYGSGKINFQDAVWNIVGATQVYPAPVTPLTVNEVIVHALSNTSPLTGDAVLYMEIRNAEMSSSGGLDYGDETYETLVAYPEDCTIGYTYNTTNYWNVAFHKKVEDDFGVETNAPFVLDKDFGMVITGLDQPGCDVGFMGLDAALEDDGIIPDGNFVCENNGEYIQLHYTGATMCLDAGFMGFFDAVEVPTSLSDGETDYDNCNVLRASVDGSEVSNEKYPEIFGSFVYVELARPIFDADENENYEFLVPDWVTNISYQEFEDSEETGMYVFTFECEPLPEGETGRSAKIFIKGSGVTSADPIYLLQGDVTFEDGIENVTTTASTVTKKAYSISGQQVGDNFKGIVVKDGKKMIRK